ncbi:exodeoxyribonuclease III [Candidatus Saccharibacteria bacterium]|nr:exodeoxyribonuclease III [Candidatus Saccharibacteria bacterium]MCL1962768.1 exodeoxyribonuclease III [Candidatus Saccharibacteria bacterium]
MKIFSWNVNGLRAVIKKGEFQKFIDNYQPDVLCIQETKMQPGQVAVDLPEYREFWNSAERAGYAGTAIFVRNGFSDLVPLNAFYNFSEKIAETYEVEADQFGDPNAEGRILTLEFDKFFLVNVYTPNSKDDLARLELRSERWDVAFAAYVSGLRNQKPVIFCGDLNVAHTEIDLANPKQKVGQHGFTIEERAGFQNFLNAGFIDTFRAIHGDIPNQYTWWSYLANARARNVGWRIDYFLIDEKLRGKLKDAAIYPDQMGSDHCPISIEMEDL